MCGIAGYVEFEGPGRDRSIIEGMAHALRRRGPDSRGVFEGGPCRLAHTRLSIIDLALSTQPMSLPDAPLTLVYNGELYNYLALKAELLASGERFATSGDTEVVARMIARHGSSAFARFNGMFGLAAWNAREQTLLLARDPLGEKPLFYAAPRAGVLVFGSEIKALRCYPGLGSQIHIPAVRQALRFRAVYGEESLYEGIRQLPPGHALVFSRAGLKIERFFDLVEATDRSREALKGESDEAIIERGREMFRNAVVDRLMADVPVGAFLSGGLDSSMLVATMCRHNASPHPVRTFSVGFEGDPWSELPHAREVATMMQTEHHEVLVGPSDYERRLEELSECRDGPVSEPADVAIACMSRLARQSVKVVLSGEGADEAFAGYPKYAYASLSGFAMRLARAVGPSVLVKAASLAGLDARRAAVLARAVTRPTELERLAQWFSYVERDSLASWFPGLGWDDDAWRGTVTSQASALRRVQRWDALPRMQAVDCLTWLPGNMLERGDRMTMAEGLEARPPFLDQSLVAFGLALPDHLKIHHGKGKRIVRAWAQGLVPPVVLEKRKWGFRVPLAEWFRGPLRSYMRDALLDRSGFLASKGDRARIVRLIEEHETGAVDHGLTLWTILTVEIWARSVQRSAPAEHNHTPAAPLNAAAR